MDGRPVLHADNGTRKAVQYGGPPIQLPTESRVLGHNSRKYTPIEIQLRLRDKLLTLRQGGRTVSQYMERFTCQLTFAMDVAETERLQAHYFIRGFRPEI
ncbi:hypothetical protein Syun_022723 [Stephania yunnanensis]|uniref:Retrotransposon gag domain-containing protein n=1 Tax=Stephania yunnanensis TaxID=152371 RepID=A0AAP0FF74_9MAGN